MSEFLDESVWVQRAGAHRDRVDAFCAPHLERRRTGRAHPVWDFLFTYYSLRPRRLRCWHPGFGVVLGGAAAREYVGRAGYGEVSGGVAVTVDHLRSRTDTVDFVAALLRATAARPARLNCFGLHEWAMVYRSPTPATMPCRCASAMRAPTRWWSRCRCAAATSTRTASSPTPRSAATRSR